MSHNVSLPYCIHSRICRMFYHLLLIMLLCLSCTSADCFKPPMCNGFSFFVYLFLYCNASGCPLTCCCSLGFCKCHWPSRRCKSIGRCKPWDPALLSKGIVLSILSFAVEKYRFEWWQPNINKAESSQCEIWFVACRGLTGFVGISGGGGEEGETICAGLCHLGIAGAPAQHQPWLGMSWAVWPGTICGTAAWCLGKLRGVRGRELQEV